MSIPKNKVKIGLKKDTPTPLSIPVLQKQLNNLGLDCAYTTPKRLEVFQREVTAQFPDGINQSFGIHQPKQSSDMTPYYRSMYDRVPAPYLGLTESSKGDWKPEASALGYSTQLSTVVFPRNFEYLTLNRAGFAGNRSEEKTNENKYETVDAIKDMFIQLGIEASASLVKGLDKSSLNSILSNAIAPINEKNVKDYYNADSRVVFLVENYNPLTEEADAIGVLGIDWELKINDYLEKKKSPKHDTKMTISTRSILYDSIAALEADIVFLKANFGEDLFGKIPSKKKEVKIFDKLPPSNDDTFKYGLPLIAKDDYVDVLIMYAPNLQSVGSIDNTLSSMETSFSKTITSGFTFTMGQKITVGAEFEAGVVFAKGKVSVGLEVSFTEQWNNSQSETITFKAPAEKKAFSYQGYLLTRKLRFSPEDGSYTYVEDEGRFLTNILKTSTDPIVGDVLLVTE
ncbi:hypothetical protein WNY78_01690 [Psychroserpens sp. AS72]|uniref:hypothetical protein n=1 Tax=Psychroserpens sp. AS72 TaxID=3135775 RepID=UPI00317AEED4